MCGSNLGRFRDNVANCAFFRAALWEADDVLVGDLVATGTGLVTPAVHVTVYPTAHTIAFVIFKSVINLDIFSAN